MRTALTASLILALPLAGCQGSRRYAPAPAAQASPSVSVPPIVSAQPPASGGPQRLRYIDVKDMPIRNGVLMARANQQQLAQIEDHVGAIRAILREAGTQQPTQTAQAPSSAKPGTVVQIHSVSDIVEGLPQTQTPEMTPGMTPGKTPQDVVDAALRTGLGPDLSTDAVIRWQGQHNLVVKALPATHDRIAEILDGLRAGE